MAITGDGLRHGSALQADPGQRVGPLVVLPDMLREFGVDPEELLRERGLPVDALASAERRIPFFQVGRLLKSAAERTGCEHFGLLLGQRLGLQHMGTLGGMARNAGSVGEALRTMAVHQRLYSHGALAFVLDDGKRVTLGYSVVHGSTTGAEQIHAGMVAWMLNLVRELTTPRWVPRAFQLAHSRPADVGPYRRALPGPIEFNAEITGLLFDSAVLRQRIRGADPGRYAMFEAQVAAIGRRSLLNDVRRALRLQMIHGKAANDGVAQTLDMHRRTLHRRLRQCGTTFRQVLDEVRYDTARHFLHTTDIPMLEIAIALGYSDVTAFTRAFRRWSGQTPRRYREQQSRQRPNEPPGTARSAHIVDGGAAREWNVPGPNRPVPSQ